MNKRYVYFVSYWFAIGENTQGFGHCEMFAFGPIDTHQSVIDMGKNIEERARQEGIEQSVTVLGWKLLQVQRESVLGGWEKIEEPKGGYDDR